ncbi:MAG: tryptophan synthase subunit alpha, partial [Thermodesulfovibrionales bacterium]
MSRIKKRFAELKKEGRKAFIAYIMAGDPDLERTRGNVLLLERCGTDIIELGVPFSDPVADGPTIQHAAERALKAGVTLTKVIGLVKELREKTRIPIVLMTYYNPVLRYGLERFVADAVHAGVDGVIIPDLPPEEAQELTMASKAKGLDTIFLIAPTSTGKRIEKITRACTGFV